jgi:hypothetical protein
VGQVEEADLLLEATEASGRGHEAFAAATGRAMLMVLLLLCLPSLNIVSFHLLAIWGECYKILKAIFIKSNVWMIIFYP